MRPCDCNVHLKSPFVEEAFRLECENVSTRYVRRAILAHLFGSMLDD